MIRHLRHWYDLCLATFGLTLAFARAARHFRTRALRDLALPYPAALSSREKRRLKHYHYGTTYLGVVFCALRGYPRSRREEYLFTNLAALACFFDDLVDAFRRNDDSGRKWRDNPEEYGRTADSRGLALHFLHNIYRALPSGDLEQFKTFMHRVFNVETAGRQHPSAMRGAQESLPLEKITAEKGGCSVLLFRRLLANPLSDGEREALFQFGYLIQLCDDIFDLWHDRQAGNHTLATYLAERNDVAKLSQVFENQVVVVREAIRKVARVDPTPGPFPDGSVETRPKVASSDAPHPPGAGRGVGSTQAAIHFLVGITRVCLRHYADLQKKRGTLPLDDRAAMVVDMERWDNRLRAMGALLVDK